MQVLWCIFHCNDKLYKADESTKEGVKKKETVNLTSSESNILYITGYVLCFSTKIEIKEFI